VLVRVRAAGVNGLGLTPDGAIVTAAAPDILARTPAGRRGLWFVNRPDATLLARLAAAIDQGTLISRLREVVGFNDIAAAIERQRTGPRIGIVVAERAR
jgi:NADPH:quinone reductase-like Zn-dependent oxidoreductase